MKFVALLRGVNVGGKNKLKMAELKSVLLKNGFKNVSTYIQSGNIVFDSGKTNQQELAKQIHIIIHSEFGLEIPVLVKSHPQILEVITNIPFSSAEKNDSKKIYFSFLYARPNKELVMVIDTTKYHPDQFIIKDDIIYLYYYNGAGKSKMTNAFFEKQLKTYSTTRNWNTVHKLLELSK